MVRTFKALQFAALLALATSGAIVLAGIGNPARAAEEQLHSSSFRVYGLIPSGEGDKGATRAGSFRTASAETDLGAGKMKSGSKRGNANAGNEPRIEDPPMPTYDGPAGGQGNIAN